MKYKLLLFDADGTLFDFEKCEKHALEELFKCYKFNEEYEVWLEKYKRINNQLWKELEQGKMTTSKLKTERFRRLLDECSIDADFCEVSKRYVDFLSKGTFLLDGAEDICSCLSERYTLAIVTNGITEVQYPRLKNSAIAKYISYLIVSEEAGSQKPAIEIFDYTFKKTGNFDKNSAIIIGDSLSSDIQGGINYGIDTCWYNPLKSKNAGSLPITFEITDLYQLKDIL